MQWWPEEGGHPGGRGSASSRGTRGTCALSCGLTELPPAPTVIRASPAQDSSLTCCVDWPPLSPNCLPPTQPISTLLQNLPPRNAGLFWNLQPRPRPPGHTPLPSPGLRFISCHSASTSGASDSFSDSLPRLTSKPLLTALSTQGDLPSTSMSPKPDVHPWHSALGSLP